MNRWVLVLFGLLFLFCACDKNSVSGNSVETENTVALVAVDAEGNALSNALFRIRPESFVVDTLSEECENCLDLQSDSFGKTELEELLNVCKWEWTSIEGTYGYKVKGLNGKYIFLPSAGYQDQGGQGVGNHGFYMSSTPGENLNYNCYVMNFASDQILQLQVGNRHWGMSIRPVTDK